MSCAPTGSPSPSRPQGKAAAGSPARLAGTVNRSPSYRSRRAASSPSRGAAAGVTAGALHFWDGNSDQSQFHLLGYVDLPGAASVVARCTHTAPSSEYTALELTAAIPQTGETAGYFWETVTLPGGTTYLHPDQLTVLDQAGHPLCTYDLTNHWGYASYPLSETR